jgi:hypothetical protein
LDKNSNQNQLEPKEYIPVYYIYKVHGGGSHGHNLKIENVDNDTLRSTLYSPFFEKNKVLGVEPNRVLNILEGI